MKIEQVKHPEHFRTVYPAIIVVNHTPVRIALRGPGAHYVNVMPYENPAQFSAIQTVVSDWNMSHPYFTDAELGAFAAALPEKARDILEVAEREALEAWQ